MVRNYKRKTERGKVSEETMLLAVAEVKKNKRSVRSVSDEFGIPRKTLGRYCDKFESTPSNEVIKEPPGVSKVSEDVTVLLPQEVTVPKEPIPPGLSTVTEILSSVPDVAIVPVKPVSTEPTEIASDLLPTHTSDEALIPERVLNSPPTKSSGVFSSFGYAKRFQVRLLKFLDKIPKALYYNDFFVVNIYDLG